MQRERLTSPQILIAFDDPDSGPPRWLSVDALRATTAHSSTPREPGHEILDSVGFGPFHIGPHETLEVVVRVGRGIATYGPAFAHWAALAGSSDAALSQFLIAFVGRWPSRAVFAEEVLDDLGLHPESLCPAWLAPFTAIDFESLATPLLAEVTACEDRTGLYVFDTRYPQRCEFRNSPTRRP